MIKTLLKRKNLLEQNSIVKLINPTYNKTSSIHPDFQEHLRDVSISNHYGPTKLRKTPWTTSHAHHPYPFTHISVPPRKVDDALVSTNLSLPETASLPEAVWTDSHLRRNKIDKPKFPEIFLNLNIPTNRRWNLPRKMGPSNLGGWTTHFGKYAAGMVENMPAVFETTTSKKVQQLLRMYSSLYFTNKPQLVPVNSAQNRKPTYLEDVVRMSAPPCISAMKWVKGHLEGVRTNPRSWGRKQPIHHWNVRFLGAHPPSGPLKFQFEPTCFRGFVW